MEKNIRNKIIEGSIKDHKWKNRARQRQEEKGWRELSAKIAIKILRHLRENKITQKKAAEQLNYSPQYLNKVLKGKENLTLETIDKIQVALNITLIEVPSFQAINVLNYSDDIAYNWNKTKNSSTVLTLKNPYLNKQKEQVTNQYSPYYANV